MTQVQQAPNGQTSGPLRSRMGGLQSRERPKRPTKIRHRAETLLDLEDMILSPAYQGNESVVTDPAAVYENAEGSGVYVIFENQPFILTDKDEHGNERALAQVGVSSGTTSVSYKILVIRPEFQAKANGAALQAKYDWFPHLFGPNGQPRPIHTRAAIVQGLVSPEQVDTGEVTVSANAEGEPIVTPVG